MADEEPCRRFFDHHAERFTTPLLVEAAHILIEADPADDFAMGLATGDARTLIRALEADPSRFEELARTRSACPSREQGGNLGFDAFGGRGCFVSGALLTGGPFPADRRLQRRAAGDGDRRLQAGALNRFVEAIRRIT